MGSTRKALKILSVGRLEIPTQKEVLKSEKRLYDKYWLDEAREKILKTLDNKNELIVLWEDWKDSYH